MPADAQEAARPGMARSRSVTSRPRRRSSRAAASPTAPPPITITSGTGLSSKRIVRENVNCANPFLTASRKERQLYYDLTERGYRRHPGLRRQLAGRRLLRPLAARPNVDKALKGRID